MMASRCAKWAGLALLITAVCLPTIYCLQWLMVFRGVSGRLGGGNNIFHLWSNPGTAGETVACAKQVGRRCHSHYKNKLVDNWSKLRIHEIKLAVFEGGREKANIVFGPVSDKSNWFRKEHIRTSSYADLNNGGFFNFFSINGQTNLRRRFLISRHEGGYSNDIGMFWFGVFETSICDWDGNPGVPTILYSPGSRASRWNTLNTQTDEHDNVRIRCSHGGTIHIKSASYGIGSRWTSGTFTMRRRCNYQYSCDVKVENDIFTDPSVGDEKVLKVSYTCGPHIADDFTISVKAEDQSKIENCEEIDLDCYYSLKGHCKKCNHALPVVLYEGNTECAWLCSQQNRQCWPGTCGPDNVAKHCQCDEGFSVAKDSTRAKCIMTRKPTIEMCFAGVHGSKGEHVTLRKLNSSSACKDQRDNFINFQATKAEFTLQYTLTIKPSMLKPTFIKEYKFGIGDGSFSIQWRQTIKGKTAVIHHHRLVDYGVLVENLEDTINVKNNDTSLPNITLENGDGLCYTFMAIGKGYLMTTALNDPNTDLPKEYYNETKNTRELCFWFDNLKPVHCKVTGECSDLDIIQLSNSVTKSPNVTIGLMGWKDLNIYKGKQINASGIREYTLSVYNINGDGAELKADLTADKSNARKSDTAKPLHIELASCGLYEINLEVVDSAGEGNSQIARRFVLFDNCSQVQKDPKKNILITTADDISNKTWQTQKRSICFDWTGYFYNSLHKKTNLLKPIKTKAIIPVEYEDNEYPLPTKGTTNTDGIVEFNFTITVNDVKRIPNQRHENILIQKQCTNMSLQDGDYLSVEIVATDVMGNSNTDSVIVYIDTSVPEITNIGLERQGFKELFVHNAVDLSTMKITLSIQDVHSGIRSIQWYLGTNLGSTDIGNGTLAVNRLPKGTSCINNTECYCPSLGPCENTMYSIDLSKLVRYNNNIGQHNRDYFFTFVVTNNAFLRIVDHVDILVDESVPVKGVVREGALGEKDKDFTNENTTIINWDGFIDHESGIRLYQVAMFSRCLNSDEILNIGMNKNIVKVNTTENSVRLYFPKEDKYITSVIAFNNAGDRSDVACSDGITYDASAVKVFNVTGKQFTTKEGIACDGNGNPFLILENLKRVQLSNSTSCHQICSNFTFPEFVENLPKINLNPADETYSDGICQKSSPFKDREIYIPSDKIDVYWDFQDLESQVDDFYVGFGHSESEYLSPSLLSFTKTSGHPRYINFHSGFRSAEKFWMYIKSINKAGTVDTIRIGPMIIDSTPVLFGKDFLLEIEDGNIYIGWEKGTFVDQEEVDPVDTILFRIGTDSKFVTPFLQHYNSTRCPRSNMVDCIIYPVKQLHRSKTENSLNYMVEITVKNKAGHMATTKTKPFRVPSQVPPSRGIVFDTTEMSSELSDLDYVLHQSKLCVKWNGFTHHRNITFEVGVGTTTGKDNVIHYTPTSATDKLCFDTNIFQPFVKYYSSVRARCSGGETVVSSDGIQYIDEKYFASNFYLRDGKGCSPDRLQTSISPQGHPRNGSNVMINDKLTIGKIYSLVFDITAILMNHPDVIILKTIIENNRKIVIFVAKSQTIDFTVQSNTAFNVSFYRCNLDVDTVKQTDLVAAHWNSEIDEVIRPTHYIVNLMQENKGHDDQLISMLERSRGSSSASFENISFLDNTTYFIDVSPCFGHFCLNLTSSDGFKFNSETLAMRLKDAVLYLSEEHAHPTLNATWEISSDMENPQIPLERWTLSLDEKGRDNILNWTAVRNEREVFETLDIQVSTKRRLYFCMQVWVGDEEWLIRCIPVKVENRRVENHFNVLDVELEELNRTFVDLISRASYSNSLGNLEYTVYDLEIDYCTPDSQISVLVLGHNGAELHAFLMTSPITPDSVSECTKRLDCLTTAKINQGIGSFTGVTLTYGTVLFSCIRGGNISYGCSDGIFVDSTPPRPGRAEIKSSQGFITSRSALLLYFEPFEEDAKSIGTHELSPISYYEYGIGTMRKTDDVLAWQKTSQSGYIYIRQMNLTQGETYYLSLSASNRAGLKSSFIVVEFTVDVTPPSGGKFYIGDVLQKKYISSHIITIHWRGFADDESNVQKFECCVISSNGDIVVPFTAAEGSSMIINNNQTLIDGHSYKGILKITNRALLSTIEYSNEFTVDTSPPHSGTVFDGNKKDMELPSSCEIDHCSLSSAFIETRPALWEELQLTPMLSTQDEDYQKDLTTLCASWNGFYDPHTDIVSYRIGLGNNPTFPDVQSLRDVGLRQEYCWKMSLTSGQKYFTFVEACNGAMLCSKLVSDGLVVDNSPPLTGLVYIRGVSGRTVYLSDRTSISASWVGFEDPHSSIDHFEWCIGMTKETCDILPYRNSFLSNDIFQSSLMLPLKTDMFLSVMAFNNVNLTVKTSSHVFKVDDTAPNIVSQPKFHPMISPFTDTSRIQYDNSLLKLSWLFSDEESRISHHFISLRSQSDKKVPFERVIHDNVNAVTIPFNTTNRLLNGDRYTAMVTACNQADLCTVSESNSILIDSTPPHLGGFTSKHFWKKVGNQTMATVSWYGFKDLESNIAYFQLSVGSSYNGGELTTGFIKILGNQTSVTIPLHEFSPNLHNEIILSIYAVNNAGLKSKTAKATVLTSLSDKSGSSGRFLLQRFSCRSYFCNNDCTCGVVGLSCVSKHRDACKETNKTHFDVFIGSSDFSEVTVLPSTSCILGSWRANSSQIKRYEWTIGLTNYAPGQGVYDIQKDNPWIDNNLETTILFCLPTHKTFVNNQKYTLYVRAWISENEYHISKSKSITIKDRSPRIRRGKFISESRNKACEPDIDFAKSNWKICACWRNVFSDDDDLSYTFSVGTSPKLDDVLQRMYLGNQTEICPALSLQPGLRYFFTVGTVNNVGLYAGFSSDGFVVDDYIPSSGVVFNSPSQENKHFFSEKSNTGVSWIGFTDSESFIRNYEFATQIYENGSFHFSESSSVEFLTSAELHDFKDNTSYRYAVQATDAAGHQSNFTFSAPFTVDNTNPHSFHCRDKILIQSKMSYSETTALDLHLKQGILYKFAIYDAEASWDTVLVLKFEDEVMRFPIQMNANGSAEAKHIVMATTSGRTTIFITQQQIPIHKLNIDIYQCYPEVVNSKEAIEFVQLSPAVFQTCVNTEDSESGLFNIKLGFGTTENGTQIMMLSDIGSKHHFSLHSSLPHGSPIFVHAVAENNANLQSYFVSRKSIVDHTPPHIVVLSQGLEYAEVNNSTLVRLTLLFRSEDIESGVKFCRVCIENTHGKTIYHCKTTMESRFISDYFNATHGSKLITVVSCVNKVELETTLKERISIVSFKEPTTEKAKIEFLVPDLSFRVEDLPVQSDTTKMEFRWSGFEDDSGTLSYDCKLQKGPNVIHNWISVNRHDYASFDHLKLANGDVYTVFIRARNNGGKISLPVNASVRIDSAKPTLTGFPVTVVNSHEGLRLDWNRVFVNKEHFHLKYDVSVGTASGSGDILHEEGLKDTAINIDVMEHVNMVYVVVKASFPTSTFRIYSGRFVI